MLGLHAEQEGRGEVLVGEDAGDECSILHPEEVLLLVVPVVESNQPPEEAEDEPGDHEAGKESKESVAPLQVQDGREHVLREQFYILTPTEWSTLIGPDPSRYCALIGGTLLCLCLLGK